LELHRTPPTGARGSELLERQTTGCIKKEKSPEEIAAPAVSADLKAT